MPALPQPWQIAATGVFAPVLTAQGPSGAVEDLGGLLLGEAGPRGDHGPDRCVAALVLRAESAHPYQTPPNCDDIHLDEGHGYARNTLREGASCLPVGDLRPLSR